MPENHSTTCRVRFEPSGAAAEVPRGETVLEAARRAGVYLSAVCGGDGTCGKCRVTIREGDVDASATTLLSDAERRRGTVLACQARVRSDLVVDVPEDHALDTARIVVHAGTRTANARDATRETAGNDAGDNLGRGAYPFDPPVRKVHLAMTPPSDDDQVADHERLQIALRKVADTPRLRVPMDVLRRLPGILQAAAYDVTAVVARPGDEAEVLAVEPGDTTDCHYAVAVDAGTTTVVAHLVDLATATVLDAEAVYNSQMSFGDDYIRRIMVAEERDAFDEMQRLLAEDINGLIRTLTERHGTNPGCITALVCAGNTTMIHFLLGLDARRIRRSPYVPAAAHVPAVRAAEVGLAIHPHGLLYCLPAVGAYVGADIVAGILATGLDQAPGLNLFVDIGTNGEIVLTGGEWMVCASSSAGPAFEGSGIRCGMRAAAGAIERVAVRDGRLVWRTIGDGPPRGLCGSGLLDALAAMLEAGLIDRTGRFTDRAQPHLTDGPDGPEFALVPAEGDRPAVVITAADVSNLIRSKAGVYAAIEILMQLTGTDASALDAVLVAGGFGHHLDVRSAVTVGLLPDLPADRVRFVGNTSLAGARMALESRLALAAAERIADRMTYVDLMHHPGYMDAFTQANFLPHTDVARFPSVQQGAAGTAE